MSANVVACWWLRVESKEAPNDDNRFSQKASLLLIITVMCHLMLIAAKYTLSAAGGFLKEASSVISFRIVRELISWCFLSQQIMSCEYVHNVFSSNDEHFHDICSYFEILEQHQRSAADLTHRLISSWLSGLSPFLGNHLLIPTSSKARCQSNVIQMYFHFECFSTTSIKWCHLNSFVSTRCPSWTFVEH